LKEYIVSFIGVAPMDDPQICILVLLDNPDEACGVYVSGGNMGAPTVGNMMADILPYLGVEATYTEQELETMDRSVPSTVGLPLSVAQMRLEEQGLTYRVIGDGANVTLQMPAANSIVAAKSQIVLFADATPSEDLEEVPDLTYLPYDIARQRLGYLALFINTDSHNITGDQSQVVAHQSIAPGEKVEHGTVVRVTLTDNDSSTNGRY
jgi:stage V sporulation protein D (sporulation-specific penicillin-binding protein)